MYGLYIILLVKNVGTGLGTLMSISDGLHPSIFCQKMEKRPPMSEETDGRGVYFSSESALPLCFLLMQLLSTICFSTWRVNKHVSLQGTGKKRRNESTKRQQ